MEKQLQLASSIFATGANKTVKCCKDVTIGMTIDNPSAASKAHRPASSLTKPAKISNVVLALDQLLTQPDTISAVKVGDALYTEVSGAGILCRGKDIRWMSASPNTKDSLTAFFLFQLLFGKNDELRTVFKAIAEEHKTTGTVEDVKIGLLCDSYYFGNCKEVGSVTVRDGLLEPELDQMVRQYGYQKPELFNGLGLTRPKNIKSEEKKTKKIIPKGKPKNIIKDCLAGVYHVDYTWNEEQKPYIQDRTNLSDFVPNETFTSMLEKIRFRTDRILARMKVLEDAGFMDRVKAIGKDYINVTFSGKPGTGKTRLAYALAEATGMPIYTVSNSHNTDEDEYQGMTKMVDGKPTAVPTDAVRCYENGGILLLEEINLTPAPVTMGALGQAIEFPFILKKDGYIPIRRHPLCIIISTMNTGTAGSKVLSQPFANRFKQSFVLDDPSREDFIRILRNTGAGRDICTWVYDSYENVIACVKEENATADVESILLSLSMRSCMGAIENIQEGMDPRDAVKNSIIGKISEQDMTVAENCARALRSMRDPDFEEEEDE